MHSVRATEASSTGASERRISVEACRSRCSKYRLVAIRMPVLDPAYTLQQLRNFHHDVRTNDRGRLMRTVAGRMNEEEMRAVSEYIAGMAVTPGQP